MVEPVDEGLIVDVPVVVLTKQMLLKAGEEAGQQGNVEGEVMRGVLGPIKRLEPAANRKKDQRQRRL